MADKYFAGYPDGAVDGAVDDVSLLSNNILCKVLTDTDDKESMNSGSALALEDGYSLSTKEVDVNGESVWVQLEKDGDVVDEAFVTSGEDYVYKTDIGKATDVPLIIVHFGTVFQEVKLLLSSYRASSRSRTITLKSTMETPSARWKSPVFLRAASQ